MIKEQTYHPWLPWVVLFFFFNSFLLPHGLLYTTLLTPVMFYYLFKEKQIGAILPWAFLLVIPIPFQLMSGVDLKSFGASTILIVTVFLFLFTALHFVRENRNQLPSLFKRVLGINSVLVFLAIAILPFAVIRGLLWYEIPISEGLPIIPRLKLLTYEASYYALLLMPVFLYFILKAFYQPSKKSLLILLAATVPLVMAFSFGVLGALFIAMLIAIPFYWKSIPLALKRTVVLGGLSLILGLFILAFAWPSNPVFHRVENIFGGKDTSAMGRMVYSFMFAIDLIREGKMLFGIGPGQIKVLAHDMIINHYQYQGILETTVRIPNAMAETLATYGIYGAGLKLFLQVYFFIKKKVYSNFYALVLFLFIFIYQFTGSFFTNVAEIGIWVFVFTIPFKEFNLIRIKEEKL